MMNEDDRWIEESPAFRSLKSDVCRLTTALAFLFLAVGVLVLYYTIDKTVNLRRMNGRIEELRQQREGKR